MACWEESFQRANLQTVSRWADARAGIPSSLLLRHPLAQSRAQWCSRDKCFDCALAITSVSMRSGDSAECAAASGAVNTAASDGDNSVNGTHSARDAAMLLPCFCNGGLRRDVCVAMGCTRASTQVGVRRNAGVLGNVVPHHLGATAEVSESNSEEPRSQLQAQGSASRKRGKPWAASEDQLLVSFVDLHGQDW